jgi:hypothetical protein
MRSVCENSSSCNNVRQNDMHVCDTRVNLSPRLLVSCSTLNELALPIYSDNATQIIGEFLNELDIYFDIKLVPESFKLPLVAQAIKDPFAKGWLMQNTIS